MYSTRLDPMTVAYRFVHDGAKLYAWVRPTYILADYKGRQYQMAPRPLQKGLDTMEWIVKGLIVNNEISSAEFAEFMRIR